MSRQLIEAKKAFKIKKGMMEEIMKKKVAQICLLVGLLVGLIISAQAQVGMRYRANIPFDFNVGNTNLPAGDYVIELTNQVSKQNFLTIRETKTRETKIVQVIPKGLNAKSKTSKLVFNRYDNQYFLAEMITPTLNADFWKTKAESRLSKTQKTSRETVALLR